MLALPGELGLPAANAAILTGRQFFPHLMAIPFHDGLAVVFVLAIPWAWSGPPRRWYDREETGHDGH
jgi:hypothetical protein